MKPNSGLKGVDNRPFYDLDLLTKKTTCTTVIVIRSQSKHTPQDR